MNDKYLIPLFVSGTILLMLFVFFIVMYLIVQKQKQNAHFLEKSRMVFDHQNKILIARTEEQEKTMNLMSVEIHDNIGQLLNYTQMNLCAIAKVAVNSEQKILIESVQDLVEQVKRDTRNISHNLNSGFIKQKGLVKVLEEELEYINISKALVCQINIAGDKATFDPQKELLIYRLAQEAIHNITKHAGATELCIRLKYDEFDIFTMIISDNGVGFDKHKIYELNGMGFQNMVQRAILLNGSLDIESQPLQGCTITLRVKTALLNLPKPVSNEETITV